MTMQLLEPLKSTKPARESEQTLQPVRSAGRKIFKEWLRVLPWIPFPQLPWTPGVPTQLPLWHFHCFISCAQVKQLPHLLQAFIFIILSINASQETLAIAFSLCMQRLLSSSRLQQAVKYRHDSAWTTLAMQLDTVKYCIEQKLSTPLSAHSKDAF